MNYKLRVLVVEVLSKLVALAAGLTLIYAILYIFPRYVDMRAGRTSFSEVKGYFGLGLSAVVLVGALYMLLLRFSRDVRREREATRTNKRGRSTTVKFPATAAPLPARTQPVYPTKFPEYPAYWPEVRQLVLDRDGRRCGNCGSTEELHVHHIVPLTRGGTNEMGNLRTLCKSCHARLHPHMKG